MNEQLFTDAHKIEIFFDYGDWQIEMVPIVGRSLYFDYDIDKNGEFKLEVKFGCDFWSDNHRIMGWVNGSCDQFEVHGTSYGNMKDASKAMWLFEIEQSEDFDNINNIIDCLENWPELKRIALAKKIKIAKQNALKQQTKSLLRCLSPGEMRLGGII